MEYEAVKHFLKKEVKLTFNNGFRLNGEILELYSDSILFRTTQKDSVINLDDIHQVVG